MYPFSTKELWVYSAILRIKQPYDFVILSSFFFYYYSQYKAHFNQHLGNAQFALPTPAIVNGSS